MDNVYLPLGVFSYTICLRWRYQRGPVGPTEPTGSSVFAHRSQYRHLDFGNMRNFLVIDLRETYDVEIVEKTAVLADGRW